MDSSALSVSGSSQGFQSYVGLKSTASMEPSAISLKTASVVPGSAFNFGPTPSGLGLGSGLYADKDAYTNFLDEFRPTPNYYMAHHRADGEKQARTSQAPGQSNYAFLGGPQAPRPPGYPLGGHFMNPHQGALVDPNSPLYRQYLASGMLQQGLLGPTSYPPGYPPLPIRQPYDSMPRSPWM